MVDPRDLASVRTYLKEHKADLMQTYHANGIAIGKMNPTDDSYVIVIYLNDKKQKPTESINVDGIPLKFEITGPFVLQH